MLQGQLHLWLTFISSGESLFSSGCYRNRFPRSAEWNYRGGRAHFAELDHKLRLSNQVFAGGLCSKLFAGRTATTARHRLSYRAPSINSFDDDTQPGALSADVLGGLLIDCGNEIVAAAAVLGENQKLFENPGSLSGAGSALANAGRDILGAGDFLAADDRISANWDAALKCTADSLLAAASYFVPTGAAEMEDHFTEVSDLLMEMAANLKAAHTVACFQQLADITEETHPILQEVARSLNLAAQVLRDYGEALQSERGPCGVAGGHVLVASDSLGRAARYVAYLGEQLSASEQATS